MTTSSIYFVVAAVVVSGFDWIAVARRLKLAEFVCKPLAAGLFLATVLTLDPSDSRARVWLALALASCIVGDVFLMLERDAFVPGLASFAVAQVLFTVSFAVRDVSTSRLVLGLVVVIVITSGLSRRFIRALRRAGHSSLIAPIVVYMTVISTMVVSAITAGTVIAIVGAVLFMISDSLIAEERFVRARSWQPLTIIVSYHAALAGLVLGVV